MLPTKDYLKWDGVPFEDERVRSNGRGKENRIPDRKVVPGWTAKRCQAWTAKWCHFSRQVDRKVVPYPTQGMDRKVVPYLG